MNTPAAPWTRLPPQRIRSGLLAALVVAASVRVHTERLPLRAYTTDAGLPRDQVHRIVRDSRGFLWFCTDNGLSRFDGHRFVTYTAADGLPDTRVRDLLETRDGHYWVATAGGIAILRETATPIFLAANPPGNPRLRSTMALRESRSGDVWVGTSAGLMVAPAGDAGALRPVDLGLPSTTSDEPLVQTVVEDRDGSVWVGTRGSGLYRRRLNGGVEHYTTLDGLPSHRVDAILDDHDHRLWVATSDGLCVLAVTGGERAHVIHVWTSRDGLTSDWTTAVFESTDRTLWIGTNAGLSAAAPGDDITRLTFRSFGSAHGLAGGAVNDLTEDSGGNLWIGTESGGAYRLSAHGFTTFTAADGLDGGVTAIFYDRAGELCFTNGHVIWRYDGNRFAAIVPALPANVKHYTWGWNQLTLQDRADEWWIPTGQGLFRFGPSATVAGLDGARPKSVYRDRDGFISDDMFRLFEDSRGDIWVSAISPARSGITRWERRSETFRLFTPADGLPGAGWAVESICEDRAANVWLGLGASGLARYQDGRFAVFTHSDGLPLGLIRGCHLDRRGRLWLAVASGGLARLDDPASAKPAFATYTTAHGLSSNEIYTVAEDRAGRLYLGMESAVNRLDPDTGEVRRYGTSEGLPRGLVRQAFTDRNGAVWFAGDQGLARMAPELNGTSPQPTIFFSALKTGAAMTQVSPLGAATLPASTLGPSDTAVEVSYFSIGYRTADAPRYQYRLAGAETEWSRPTTLETVRYAALAPGHYQFMVRAVLADGTSSATPASVSLTILAPVWQRWWFVASASALGVLLIYGAVRVRFRRLLELEKVRTRIAADLHDDVGSSLSKIAILSEVVQRQAAQSESPSALAEIAETSRTLVDTMSDIVWSVDPWRDDLESLVVRVREFASDFLEARSIAWTFDAPQGNRIALAPEQRRQLYLVIKECITNIVRHANAARVSIALTVVNGHLLGVIEDDGMGFDATAPGRTNGRGVRNIEGRIQQIGGRLTIVSSPAGTVVSFHVPLR